MKQNHPEDARLTNDTRKKSKIVIVIVISLLFAVLCAGYLFFAWSRYQKMAKAEAIILAESVESLLHPEHIAALTGSPEDVTNPEYKMMKGSLSRLIRENNQIRFAYILGMREADMVFLIDSEDEVSTDYSQPGQIYYEATPDDRIPFLTGRSVLNGPAEDRWGTWYSALIPIEDPVKHTVLAVLGIDYSVEEWNQRILRRLVPDIVIIVSLLSVCIALFNSWKEHQKVKERAYRLSIDEALFHSVFDQAPIGISIVRDKNFSYQSEQGNLTMNSMFEKILGRSSAELATIEWPDITYYEDLQADLEQFDRFSKGETDGYSLEKRFVKPDGSIVWTNMIIASIAGGQSKYPMHLCLLEDITARKKVEEEHIESERSKSVLLSHLPGLAYRCKYDTSWMMLFVSDGCLKLTGYPPEALLLNRDLSYHDVIAPEYRNLLENEWKKILPKREFFKYEYEIITAQNERRWVLELGQGIFDKRGEVEALEGIILDISARKKSEKTLKYNSEYDVWTGLHNRAFLEGILKMEQHTNATIKRALIGINLSTMHLLGLTYGFQYSQGLIKRAADALRALS
ncbi:MAG TPA: PAS domain S-box protein, partial [Negativicutes bacterium]|nr:PAS domain S-box protein [Negativicutes bacterium]